MLHWSNVFVPAILYSTQSNLSLLKYHLFSYIWPSSLYISLLRPEFSYFSLLLKAQMYFGQKLLMSLAKSLLLQFIAQNQAASSLQLHLFLVPDMFLVRGCFSPHCITLSWRLESDLSFEVSLSHFSDFQELCLLLSSKIAAVLCSLCSFNYPVWNQDFFNLFSAGFYKLLLNFLKK